MAGLTEHLQYAVKQTVDDFANEMSIPDDIPVAYGLTEFVMGSDFTVAYEDTIPVVGGTFGGTSAECNLRVAVNKKPEASVYTYKRMQRFIVDRFHWKAIDLFEDGSGKPAMDGTLADVQILQSIFAG